MEVALYLIRLLQASPVIKKGANKEKDLYRQYARIALTNLKNPFAIKMLQRELEKSEKASGGAEN